MSLFFYKKLHGDYWREEVLILFLCLILNPISSQTYSKKRETSLRLLTYNSHYCKGAADPGNITSENIQRFARVIRALNPDVVAIQELDSASRSRGGRYLLEEIARATRIDYVPYYGSAAAYDSGNIGCGVLIKRTIEVRKVERIYLPGDEGRVAVWVQTDHFDFIGTHFDLNNAKRRQGAENLVARIQRVKKPLILAGDLNDSHRWNAPWAFPILQKHFTILNQLDGTTIPGRKDSGAYIDYILLFRNRAARRVCLEQAHVVRSITYDGDTVDTGTISDHYPVIVDLRLK